MDWNLLGLKLGITAKARLRTTSLAKHEEEEAVWAVCVFSFSFLWTSRHFAKISSSSWCDVTDGETVPESL